jgi:Na+/proline symporter
MTAPAVLLGLISYFIVLLVLARWAEARVRKVTICISSNSWFLAGKSVPWYVVALGMIANSVSGVTFISVPGEVKSRGLTYFQLVIGYWMGYQLISWILLPLYYRLNLTTIYTYLQKRFGNNSYYTGACFFLVSRLTGTAARLYLVAGVLHFLILENLGIPFFVTALFFVFIIARYTIGGGMQTLVITDLFQSLVLVLAAVITIILLMYMLGKDSITILQQSQYNYWWVTDWQSSNYVVKEIIAGAVIAVVMTGLDQDQMQKNLTCHTLADARRNMLLYSSLIVIVNVIFLLVGLWLYELAARQQISLPSQTDKVFPYLAMQLLGFSGAVVFVWGLAAAACSSADGALTALTTCYCVDLLKTEKMTEYQARKVRQQVHILLAVSLWILLLIFWLLEQWGVAKSVISSVLTLAGYTYGPLLGLFFIGIFTQLKPIDKWVPLICCISPLLITLFVYIGSRYGYKAGFEVIVYNGFLTAAGLMILHYINVQAKRD